MLAESQEADLSENKNINSANNICAGASAVVDFRTEPNKPNTQTQTVICPLCSRKVMIVINIKENWRTKFYTLTSESDDEYQKQQQQEVQKQHFNNRRKRIGRKNEEEQQQKFSFSSGLADADADSSTISSNEEISFLDSNSQDSFENTKKRMKLSETAAERNDINTSTMTTIFQDEEDYDLVKCISCNKFIGIICTDEACNNNIPRVYTCNEILYDSTKCTNGWIQVDKEKDRRALFVLSQIIYNVYEMPNETELEVQYAFPPLTDLSKLLWINNIASGFFSLKMKGTLNPYTMEAYSMVTLDTIFIRSIHRRQGYASMAIQNILTEFPGQNIGFSYPISFSMEKVILKHLKRRPEDRKLLWEIYGCGTQGNCRNLWMVLQNSDKMNGSKSNKHSKAL